MLTPGIGARFIAPNTPARRRTLRPMRHGRQNYAQCVAAFFRFRPPWAPRPPRLTTDGGPYRRFSHGWGWDPFVERDQLCREAQKRLENLNILEDELLSLRLTGKRRIWGIME